MTVAELDRRMSSLELTYWKVFLEILDAAKAGKSVDTIFGEEE